MAEFIFNCAGTYTGNPDSLHANFEIDFFLDRIYDFFDWNFGGVTTFNGLECIHPTAHPDKQIFITPLGRTEDVLGFTVPAIPPDV